MGIFWICVQKHMENAFCAKKSILGSKSVLFASILVNITLICIDYQYLNIPNEKTIKYISRKNKEIHKKFAKQ